MNTVLYRVVREGGPTGPGSDPAEESEEIPGGERGGVLREARTAAKDSRDQSRPGDPRGDPTQPVIVSNSPSLLNEQLLSVLRGVCPCGSFRGTVTVTVSLGRDYKHKLNLVCRNTRIRVNGGLISEQRQSAAFQVTVTPGHFLDHLSLSHLTFCASPSKNIYCHLDFEKPPLIHCATYRFKDPPHMVTGLDSRASRKGGRKGCER